MDHVLITLSTLFVCSDATGKSEIKTMSNSVVLFLQRLVSKHIASLYHTDLQAPFALTAAVNSRKSKAEISLAPRSAPYLIQSVPKSFFFFLHRLSYAPNR